MSDLGCLTSSVLRYLVFRPPPGPVSANIAAQYPRLRIPGRGEDVVPRAWGKLSASAIGFYGDCADRLVSEDNQAGSAFISEVCARWEAAAGSARDLGIRTVCLRLGMVLTPKGGALARLLALRDRKSVV